ncbi:MAG TPA: hypothetical protein ENJ68_03825 [Devosia sp.]|nr:hypothetical protein [Devosia sp.]
MAELEADGPINTIDDVLARLDAIEALPEAALKARAEELAARMLGLGETILQFWVRSRGETPTTQEKEGFVILALHRQGAKGEPSFNACRETCREIVFQHNVILQSGEDTVRLSALRLMVMVVRHLALFVSGKLEVAGLGEFCCASKSIRQKSDIADATNMI